MRYSRPRVYTCMDCGIKFTHPGRDEWGEAVCPSCGGRNIAKYKGDKW